LNAEFDVLWRRTSKRRNDRPLLQTAEPAETLRRLLAEREPTYALADITVKSRDLAHDILVDDVMLAAAEFLRTHTSPPEKAAP
jgi:shikimate kinase